MEKTEIYKQFITTKLAHYFSEEERNHSGKLKASFWATDCDKLGFDLYHNWLGTEKTEGIGAEKLIMFQAAKMLEKALIQKLQEMGLVEVPVGDKEDPQFRIEMVREGVPVTGYLDGKFIDGTPCEIKTFYGDYQARELALGRPKLNYLMQLAVYIDALGVDKGKLIYMDRGSGAMYEFTLNRIALLKFKCMGIEFDLAEEYQRWAKLYNDHILKKITPDVFEAGKYKEDINLINWSQISKSDISAARNGRKVLGSNPQTHWKILYSPYKRLIVEGQGVTLGYSEEELKTIKNATKGYSTY